MTGVLLALAMGAALAASAFCAGAETGFLSVSRGRITHLARAGSARAQILQRALGDMPRTIIALLVGGNLANVAFSSASAALAARLCGAHVGAQALWSAAAALLVLCAGEFLPKLFFATRPLRRLLALAPAYRVFAAALTPLTALASGLTGLFSAGPAPREQVTANDLLRILSDRKDGVRLSDFESALIARILVLRTRGEPVTPAALLKALDDPDL